LVQPVYPKALIGTSNWFFVISQHHPICKFQREWKCLGQSIDFRLCKI